MKRLTKYIAILMALVTLLSPSAFAAETDSHWVNILDFDIGSATSNYVSFKQTGTLTYQLPHSTFFRYLQGIVQCNSNSLESMTWSRANSASRYGLTLIPLGNGLYRFYSEYNSLASDTINLHFNSTSSSTVYAEVIQFEYSLLRTWNYDEKGKMHVTENNDVHDYEMSAAGDIIRHNFSTDAAYLAKFECSDWRKYDKLTFFVYAFGVDINSISAHAGAFDVPISVDHISPNDYTHGDRFSLTLTMDLTGLDRNMTNTPFVEISGNTYGLSDLQGQITLLSVSGTVSVAETDVLPYLLKTYFSGIGDKLDDIFDKIDDFYAQTYTLLINYFQDHSNFLRPTLTDIVSRLETLLGFYDNSGDGFTDHMESQATEMEEITDVLDSVTKPPVEQMDPSVDDIVSPEDVSSYTSILQIFFSNQIFLSVCLMSLTLGLVSYTLYGKR